MDLYLMIGIIGLLYVLVFGGMALLRREGLSIRFAVESVIVTGIAVILVIFMQIPIHPAIFLLVLYVITMRVRIVVDLGSSFARRGNAAQARKLYNLAQHLWPDLTSELIIKVNQAILLLEENELDQSIRLFTEVLDQAGQGYLGVKYEAAAHYNLGVAYLRQKNNSRATVEFNSVIDTWPGSLYAHRAQQTLDRQQHKDSSQDDNEDTDKSGEA